MPMGFPGLPGLPMPNTLFPGAPGVNPALFSPRPTDQRAADKPSKPRPSQPKPAPKKVATATPAGSPGASAGPGGSGLRPPDAGRDSSVASNAHAAALQALTAARQPPAGSKTETASKSGNGPSAVDGNGTSNTSGPEVHVDATNALDVMTGAGIDLRAEQEAIGGTAASTVGVPGQFRRAGSDETQGGLYLHALDLSVKVHQIATQQGLQVDPTVLNYLSLATRQRFRNLLEAMVRTARHRQWSSQEASPGFWPGTKRSADQASLDKDERNAQGDPKRIPLFHQEVVQNPELLLSALEKVERRTEMRAKQKRAEREARYRAAMEAQASVGDAAGAARTGQPADAPTGAITVEEGGKKKHVSLKHATPDIQKKLADSVAQSALGGGSSRYSWMSSGVHGFGGAGAGAHGAGGKDAEAEAGEKGAGAAAGNAAGAGGGPAAPGAWGDLASRQAAKAAEAAAAVTRVTMSDALSALEREKAGGAGLGSGIATLRTTRALGRPAFRVPPPRPKTFSAPPAS